MKLTNSQIVSLVGSAAFKAEGALVGIHGRQQSVKLDDGKVAMETVPHTLGLGARMAIALAYTSLTKSAEAFEKVRSDLVAEYNVKATAAKQTFVAGSPLHDECLVKINDLLAMSIDVGTIKKIKVTDLNVDENKLSPMLLVALMPLLDGV